MELPARLALPEGYRAVDPDDRRRRGAARELAGWLDDRSPFGADVAVVEHERTVVAGVRTAISSDDATERRIDVAIDTAHVRRRPLFDALVTAGEAHHAGATPDATVVYRATGPADARPWFADLGYRDDPRGSPFTKPARSGSVEVRTATVADAPAIAHVHTRGWEVGYRGRIPDRVLDDPALAAARRIGWIERLRNRPPPGPGDLRDRVLVAVLDTGDGPEVVGFGHTGPEANPPDAPAPARGEVYGFYVHPRAWGSSVAGELMASCLAELRAGGVATAVLWVMADNPRARRFYERRGWGVTAETATFACSPVPGGPPLPEPIPEVRYDIDLR